MYINIDPSTSAGQSFLGKHFINRSAPDMGVETPKLQSGPQMPMPQLLHVAFGVFNSKTKLRRERESALKEKQARANTPQIAVAVSHALLPQSNLRARTSNHPARGKTNEGEGYKCKSNGHWAQDCQKSSPGHAQSANKQVIGRGAALSPEREARGLLLSR